MPLKLPNNSNEKRAKPWSGERQLAAALILSAIRDLYGEAQFYSRQDRNNARTWFREKESLLPCSFNWCCEFVGVDADWLRKRILERSIDLSRIFGLH